MNTYARTSSVSSGNVSAAYPSDAMMIAVNEHHDAEQHVPADDGALGEVAVVDGAGCSGVAVTVQP